MPGEGSVVLLGRRDEPPLFRSRNSNRPDSIDQLVSVDLATGALGVYGFRIAPTEPHKLPASSTPQSTQNRPAAP